MATRKEKKQFSQKLSALKREVLENLCREQKQVLEEIIESEENGEIDALLTERNQNVMMYKDYYQREFLVLQERLNSFGNIVSLIEEKDKDKDFHMREIQLAENRIMESKKREATFLRISREIVLKEDEIKANIVPESQLINCQQERKNKLHNVRYQLKEESEKKYGIEKEIKAILVEIEQQDGASKSELDKHIEITQTLKLLIESLKEALDEKKKNANEKRELEELERVLEERLEMELQKYSEQEKEEKEELEETTVLLDDLVEKLKVQNQVHGESNGMNVDFVNYYKEMSTEEIQKIFCDYQEMVIRKKNDLKEFQLELQRHQNDREGRIQKLKEMLERELFLLEQNKMKLDEEKRVLAELNQKLQETQERIEEQNRKKEELSIHKGEVLAQEEREKSEKIKELETRIAEEQKESGMISSLIKDASEVNEDLEGALKRKEAVKMETMEKQKEYDIKMKEMTEQMIKKAKFYENEISKLNCDLRERANILNQEKRLKKSYEEEIMQRERNLLTELANLENKLKESQDNHEFSSTFEATERVGSSARQNLRSILKLASPRKVKISQPKSPKNVRFDIRSQEI